MDFFGANSFSKKAKRLSKLNKILEFKLEKILGFRNMQEKLEKKNVFLPFSFVADMEAECSDDVMKLRVKFNDTFSGLIYSAGKLNF